MGTPLELAGSQGYSQEKLEVAFKILAHKYSNMVAERRLTAMMLQEAVEWSGRAFLPSTMRNQEKAAVSGVRELMEADPVLPYWGSSGGADVA